MIVLFVTPFILSEHLKQSSNLFRVDILISSATLTNRRFPDDYFEHDKLSRRPSSSSESSFSSTSTASSYIASAYEKAHSVASSSFDAINSIDWETTNMLLNLNHLSSKVSTSNSGANIEELDDLVELISTTQKHVDSLTHKWCVDSRTVPNSEDESSLPTEQYLAFPSRCCAVVSYIYFKKFILYADLEDGTLYKLLDIVKRDFDYAQAMKLSAGTPERRFWMMYVGGCAAVGRSERLWFHRQLSFCRETLQLKTWNEAREVLKNIAWVDFPGEVYGRALWDELVSAE
jgi:hypothetical protein